MSNTGLCAFTSRRGYLLAYLCIFWVIGLLLGAAVSCFAADFAEFCTAYRLGESGSFSLLFFITLLPFIACGMAAFMESASMMLMIAFAKAFLFAFSSQWLLLCMPDSGWLLRLLVMFSDIVCLPLLFLFICQCLNIGRRISVFALLVPSSFVGLAVAFDYAFISPMLSHLVII